MWEAMLYATAVVACSLLALYLYGSRNYNYFKNINFPHHADNTPFVGGMWPLLMKRVSMADSLNKIYLEQPQHSALGMFEFTTPVVMLRDPEQIKMVTVKDFDHFADRSVAVNEEMEPLFGKNLLSLTGQRWKDMRSTLSPAFTTSKIKAMFQFIADCGQQLGDYLEVKCKAEGNGVVELDTKDVYSRFANDVVATTAFGVHVDSLKEPNNEFFLTGKDIVDLNNFRTMIFFVVFRVSATLAKFLPWRVFSEKSKKFFQSLISDTIRHREQEGIVRPDMIQLLMDARRGSIAAEIHEDGVVHRVNKKYAAELSDVDIAAQALLFFLGGFETTSANLGFLTNMLAVHPDVQRRLQEEVDEVLEADGGKITYDGIAKMKYLDMCINESMRIWPANSASNRLCVKDYILPATANTPSIEIKKGMAVYIPVFSLQRDPKYFQNPETFDPERFSEDNKYLIRPFTFMPFGTGPRNCIGMRFALVEAKIAVVSLVSRFDLVVTKNTPVPMVLEKGGFNMRAEGGFWLGFKLRR